MKKGKILTVAQKKYISSVRAAVDAEIKKHSNVKDAVYTTRALLERYREKIIGTMLGIEFSFGDIRIKPHSHLEYAIGDAARAATKAWILKHIGDDIELTDTQINQLRKQYRDQYFDELYREVGEAGEAAGRHKAEEVTAKLCEQFSKEMEDEE